MEIPKGKLENFRLLILGAGSVITEFYLPALHLLDCLGNAFFIDSSGLALKNLAKIAPRARYQQADFKDYLLDISVKGLFDAVVVALPNYLHVEAIELAMSLGFSVLCEKPLALDANACLRLDKLSRETGQVLAVGMVRRYLPSELALRQALKDNLIGPIREIDIAWGEPYKWSSSSSSFFQRENGGILTDMGVHFLDSVAELVGPLKPVSYEDDYRGGVEANAEFRVISEGGLPITLTLSRTHKLRNTIIFKGQKGELILEKDTFDSCFWHSYHNNAFFSRVYPINPFRGENWTADLVSCFAQQFLDFRAAVDEKKNPLVTAGQAARVMALIEWAYGQRQEKQVFLATSSACSGSLVRPELSSPAPVVVTGGTGFIGGHLVARLSEFGFSEISVPVRNYQTCTEVARFPVRMPLVNLLDYGEVKKAIQGARFIFHLAYGKGGSQAERVTIEGSANVVNAAIECRAECVVVLSTMYVFGHPDTEFMVDESWPYHPAGGEYGQSKAKMERRCLKRAGSSARTRIVVLNPSCVYGPKGHTYARLPIQMAEEGTFCWIEQGKGVANYNFIDNLIDAIILAVNCKEAHGQRFIINDGYCSWRDFLGPLLGSAGDNLASFSREELVERNRPKPAGIKDIVHYFINDRELVTLLNKVPVLNSLKKLLFRYNSKFRDVLLDMQRKPMVSCLKQRDSSVPAVPVWLAEIFGPTKTMFSSEKAKKILGWRPFVSLEKGQRQTRQWLESVKPL
jgi:predicted dehydrogenase/nucleoside-diphosphate-sugar epimerase